MGVLGCISVGQLEISKLGGRSISTARFHVIEVLSLWLLYCIITMKRTVHTGWLPLCFLQQKMLLAPAPRHSIYLIVQSNCEHSRGSCPLKVSTSYCKARELGSFAN